ncbi:MAG: glycosyl hydrolase family 28-related protein [Paracoccaceae bacterium]
MNKAVTEGIVLMPPRFAEGLDVWSSGDGTPGSDTYQADPRATLVAADQDFGACLELTHTTSPQRLRFMGETPMLPGCYLRVSARVKAVSGNLPTVRVAGWAGGADDTNVPGLVEIGPSVALPSYGEVIEVLAIVGTGLRSGVDMVWGRLPVYGHFGLDLSGPTGGIVRIDDIRIEDVTHVFHRDLMNWVDVRDFGAVGDGVSDDSAAFAAADAAAAGRRVLVSKGTYWLGSSVTIDSRVQFEGTVSMPEDAVLSLTAAFDLPVYIDAFGSEELGFRKAFQALLNNADHESLDMGGRRVSVSAPIDMAAAVPNRDSYAQRRIIRNGQFFAEDGPAWETETVTSQATYSPADPRRLTGVQNVANVPVGALVEGAGVGREVYVRGRNVAAQEITLSEPLYDAAGSQVFTFRRFRYLLDFGGFDRLDKFSMSDIEFQCNGICSGVMLAPTGVGFSLRDCFFTRPMDRGITSIGEGCQGMLVDRCQFLTDEAQVPAQERVSIALNANANDVKLRNNRATQFRHFAILGGANNIVSGNHFFQGDGAANGVRLAGIAILRTNANTTIVGNYVDNCFIEWTNERDPEPDFAGGFGFSALSVQGNVFLCGDVAPWFSHIVVKPHGSGHFLHGVTITGNMFRSLNGTIDRVDRVDTTFAELDYSRMRNITVAGNTFNNVDVAIANPLRLEHVQNTAAQAWSIEGAPRLPFGGRARFVDSVVPQERIRTDGGAAVHAMPHAEPEQGPQRDRVALHWGQAVRGRVLVQMRMDAEA